MRRAARLWSTAVVASLSVLLRGLGTASQTTIRSPSARPVNASAFVEDPLDAYDEASSEMRTSVGSSCTRVQVDATCNEAVAFANLTRATVLILLNTRGASCTGTLINAPSGRPVVLTAFHCLQDSLAGLGLADKSVATWNGTDFDNNVVDDVATTVEFITMQFVFAFQFEQECGGRGAAPFRNLKSMNLIQGARALYGNSNTDILLLELEDDIPAAYQAYYMGWSARPDDVPNAAITVHHPNGDVKKIATTRRAPKTVTASDITTGSISATGAGNYFLVTAWDQGTMEPGSSGAALVDTSSMQVVGTLTGTPSRAACSPEVPVVFAKLSNAWERYGLWEALGGDAPMEPLDLEGRDPEEPRLQLQIAPNIITITSVNKRPVNPYADGIAFRVTGPFLPGERLQLELSLTSNTLSSEELTSIVGTLNTTQVTVSRNNTFYNVTLIPGRANITSDVFGLFRLVVRASSSADAAFSQQRSVLGVVGPSPVAGYSFRYPIVIDTIPYTHAMISLDSYVGSLVGLCPLLTQSQTFSSSSSYFSQCPSAAANRNSSRSSTGRRRMMQVSGRVPSASSSITPTPVPPYDASEAEDSSDQDYEISTDDLITAITDIIAGGVAGAGSSPNPVSGSRISPSPNSSGRAPASPSRVSSSPSSAPRAPSASPGSSSGRTGSTSGAVRGVVFAYNATRTQAVTISTCPDAAVDTVLMLLQAGNRSVVETATDMTLVAYNDDASPRVTCSTIQSQQLAAGSQYYIVISQNNEFITNAGANPVTLRIREA